MKIIVDDMDIKKELEDVERWIKQRDNFLETHKDTPISEWDEEIKMTYISIENIISGKMKFLREATSELFDLFFKLRTNRELFYSDYEYDFGEDSPENRTLKEMKENMDYLMKNRGEAK